MRALKPSMECADTVLAGRLEEGVLVGIDRAIVWKGQSNSMEGIVVGDL